MYQEYENLKQKPVFKTVFLPEDAVRSRHSVSHISLQTIWLAKLQNYMENTSISIPSALSAWQQLSSYPEDTNCPPQRTLPPWVARSSLRRSCAHEQF